MITHKGLLCSWRETVTPAFRSCWPLPAADTVWRQALCVCEQSGALRGLAGGAESALPTFHLLLGWASGVLLARGHSGVAPFGLGSGHTLDPGSWEGLLAPDSTAEGSELRGGPGVLSGAAVGTWPGLAPQAGAWLHVEAVCAVLKPRQAVLACVGMCVVLGLLAREEACLPRGCCCGNESPLQPGVLALRLCPWTEQERGRARVLWLVAFQQKVSVVFSLRGRECTEGGAAQVQFSGG